ncbi:NB-ARC domain-containing protein [Myxacorys almedinensis]|uniref:NB-ARC domain-containing protein n=1 Tax=Myxacorys almedinensis A TaxID=2690445 RepID=A0A8J8CH91_9CYAN|nr:NB-ARC domain-containing protein [Myxacorys almedinensis]NDJ16399.1 hypothetical protein [Myxacorys almedinensis A]
MKSEDALELIETVLDDHHLNRLQMAILHHAWQDQSYQEIASITGYEVGYVKQTGAHLWQQLSQKLGKKVTKHNLHQVLQRQDRSKPLPPPAILTPQPRIDWGDAPDTSIFYGRVAELEQLEGWLMQEGCRFVGILGMGGIGKTALTIQFGRQLQDRFDWVIWRSLQHMPTLQDLLSDLLRSLRPQSLTDLPDTVEAGLRQLLDILRHSRGLLILDNAETIMQAGHLAGHYSVGYENYGQLWRYLCDRDHRSAVLLTSREQPREMATQEGTTLPIRSLYLNGISPQTGQQLVQLKGEFIGTADQWHTLVNHYGGNPLALKMVAAVVRRCFDGQIEPFLDLLIQGQSVFDDIRQLLTGQIDRLSDLERHVLYWFAIYRESGTLADLRSDLLPSVRLGDLLEALNSLQARSLIERKANRFTLQPVVLEYLTEGLIKQASHELETLGQADPHIHLLRSHALLKADAPDYLRGWQRRLLLQPIVDQCLSQQGLADFTTGVRRALEAFREQPKTQVGYLSGNLLNLLLQLQVDLTGWDFSQLPLWQADLRGAVLHHVNLSQADVSKTAFKESFSQILAIAFSLDGKLLATGDINHEIHVRQVIDGKPLFSCRMEAGWVWSVAFSPDGRWLASSANRTVALWDVQTGECLHTFEGYADRVFSLAFSPDGRLLASGSEDRLIRIWEIKTQKLVHVLKGHDCEVRSIAFAPHRYPAVTQPPSPNAGYLLASGSFDRTVRLWDVQSGTCLKILKAHTGWVFSVAFSPEGRWLASSSRDRTVKLWQVESGHCQATIAAHPHQIRAVTFARDGKTLVTGCDDHRLRVWNYYTGECLRVLKGHQSWISAIAICPATQVLASASEDQSVRLWEGHSHRCIKTFRGHSNGVWGIALSPDTRQLASGHQDGQIRLWSLQHLPAWDASESKEPQSPQKILRGHESWVWSVAFSPHRDLLASGSEDRTVRLWHAQTGKLLSTLYGHSDAVLSVVFSQDKQTLISGSLDGTLRIWDIPTTQCRQILEGHRSGVWAIALSPDGQTLASGSQDTTIRLWELSTGRCIKVLADHRSWVRCAAFSPDGKTLASGSADGVIKLWDLANGRCAQTLQAQAVPVLTLAFDPLRPILVSSGVDATIRFWNWTETPATYTAQFGGHSRWIRELCYGSEGRVLASCSQDETIKLWQLPDQQNSIPLHRATLIQTLRVPRPYEGLNLTGAVGLTMAQLTAMQRLGAIAPSD